MACAGLQTRMLMNFYNALSEAVEPFEPPGRTVTVYVCGITPYDTTHLGHAFTCRSRPGRARGR
jgi:hypothetical protein